MDDRQKRIIEPFLAADLVKRRAYFLQHIENCCELGDKIAAHYNEHGTSHGDEDLFDEWIDIEWWYDLVK